VVTCLYENTRSWNLDDVSVSSSVLNENESAQEVSALKTVGKLRR
jgi:hypothetical protein